MVRTAVAVAISLCRHHMGMLMRIRRQRGEKTGRKADGWVDGEEESTREGWLCLKKRDPDASLCFRTPRTQRATLLTFPTRLSRLPAVRSCPRRSLAFLGRTGEYPGWACERNLPRRGVDGSLPPRMSPPTEPCRRSRLPGFPIRDARTRRDVPSPGAYP
jgi:hypothetical protein